MRSDDYDSFLFKFVLLIYGFLSWVVFQKSVPVMIRDHHDSSLFTFVVLIYGFL